jgi:hypothetical protein
MQTSQTTTWTFTIPATAVSRQIEVGFNRVHKSAFMTVMGKAPPFIWSLTIAFAPAFDAAGRVACSTHECIHGRRWMLVRTATA